MFSLRVFLFGSVALSLGLAGPAGSAAEPPLFPFLVSYDSPENVTNVAGWLDRPAGRHGFVRAEQGQLVTAAGPIRFWATNLCFDGCFPSHPQAERLAERLARLGINAVRMHHMDNRSIWGDSPDRLTIDPQRLDRLDYLIHQLKRRGIYTNLNLHVSRTLGPAEGFPVAGNRPRYDKGVGLFEPRMIELQKRYARDLLTHRNPYTGTTYAEEPAIAMVEISNENALFAVWEWGQLDDLEDPYRTTFRQLWNRWLEDRYGSTARLREAWQSGVAPLGDQLLENGDFSQPLETGWHLERDALTEVAWEIEDQAGERSLRVDVARQGEVAWRPQLTHAGFSLTAGQPYTLDFEARADQPRSLRVNCMMATEPWERLGLEAQVELETGWQQYRFTFVASQDHPQARISISQLSPGVYHLRNVRLRPGGIVGLEAEQRLEDASVPVLRRGRLNVTEPARQDWIDFLWDVERDYWTTMHAFLRDELGVRAIVSGTQLSYSPPHVQAKLDYIDAHSYWKHPVFPGRAWDSSNWYVENVAMVNDPPGTLGGLAARRVAGMGYTVSEYNHPAPIQYAAEGFPMIAAFAAFQNWDGVFTFAYSHNDDFEPERQHGYFDIKADPTRLVHHPASAAMLIRGDVAPAAETIAVPVGRDTERQQLYRTLSPWTITAGHFGARTRDSLRHQLVMDLSGEAEPGEPDAGPAADEADVFLSDTGQLRWDVSRAGAGYFTVDSPRTKLFTGFVAGRTFELGDVRLAIGPTRLDWATVSMTVIQGEGFDKPGRLLIAATGLVQNRGAELESLGGDRVTLGTRWGSPPILCEGIPAEIALPLSADRVRFYPLDPAGNRREAIEVESRDGQTILPLGPQHRTLWYEVQVR